MQLPCSVMEVFKHCQNCSDASIRQSNYLQISIFIFEIGMTTAESTGVRLWNQTSQNINFKVSCSDSTILFHFSVTCCEVPLTFLQHLFMYGGPCYCAKIILFTTDSSNFFILFLESPWHPFKGPCNPKWVPMFQHWQYLCSLNLLCQDSSIFFFLVLVLGPFYNCISWSSGVQSMFVQSEISIYFWISLSHWCAHSHSWLTSKQSQQLDSCWFHHWLAIVHAGD